MYSSVKDFRKDWRLESDLTQKILDTLTDESLTTKVYDEGRELGFIAWHLIQSADMLPSAGINISIPNPDGDAPKSAKEIAKQYKKFAEDVYEKSADIKDEQLKDMIDIYGQSFSRNSLLIMTIKHQIHHRGQMTVLMRQAGLKVPGTYGPSKEEWVNYGQEPQK